MSIAARIFIAVTVCPGLGALVGQDGARAIAAASHADAGEVARWAVIGFLAGAGVGLVFAVLAVYCVVGCRGLLRGKIADPVLLALGTLAVAELLVHRGALPLVGSVVRGATMFAWLLGLLFVVLAIRHRPRWPVGRATAPDLLTTDAEERRPEEDSNG